MIDTVLFDIGGVLTPDPYETIILHETRGIGRHLGITEKELASKVRYIWDKYAILPNAAESDFWNEIRNELDIKVSDDEIDEIKNEVIILNPEAVQVFGLLQKNKFRIGVISNNTSFFYAFQSKKLSLNKYVDPTLVFLSQEKQVKKSNGLFSLAAKAARPSTTLVIDDRASNFSIAKDAGFKAVQYSMSDSSLFNLVSKQLVV